MLIEKNVPVVENKKKYPFGQMAVGDSFFADVIDPNSIKVCASLFGKKHNKMFTVRKVDGGYRCWRTA